ncbi:restriction endonuclease [Klebsiella pneumoniae]|nr:restriction endonuclease [Klebsiella pneumoniae]
MATTWEDYQEEAASFFRSLGLEATTNVRVNGIRTHHDIDVLVKSHHAGFDIIWLVECKHWKNPVSKLHVLALREIVTEIGADRGILLSESGFQSGAIEAANLTNVHITSLAELSLSASKDIYSMRLRELYNQVEICNERYWNIPKDERIKYGLRPEVGAISYSAPRVVELCRDLFSRSFRGVYPFECEDPGKFLFPHTPRIFKSPEEVVKAIKPLISELEEKLNECERQINIIK